jgi:transcriptional antiterminator RfaH
MTGANYQAKTKESSFGMSTNFSTEGLRWYCVRSQPKREHFASGNLQVLDNVEVFCPRIRFRKGTRRGPVWFVEALFPGYLFAKFDYVELHSAVQYASGVSGILNFGKKVVVVNDDVVEALRARIGSMEEVPVFEIDPTLHVGDPVNIAQGAFTGLESVITQTLSGKDRVRVLIDFLGRQIEAEVSKMSVVRAGSPREIV